MPTTWTEVPCPDEQHDHKQRCWANGCPTCHGRGTVIQSDRKQKITIASGPEAVITRAQDLGD